jgi:hypothetical protein
MSWGKKTTKSLFNKKRTKKKTRKKRKKTRKKRMKTRKKRMKTRKKRLKRQRGGDNANKYWGRKDFLGKYAAPNLLPKKLKNELWLWRTLKHGIPLPWNNKK